MDEFIANVFPSDIYLWPYLYWGIAGALVLSGVAVEVWTRMPANEPPEVYLDLNETASLCNRSRVTDTAVVRLMLLGALRLVPDENRLEVSGPLPAPKKIRPNCNH